MEHLDTQARHIVSRAQEEARRRGQSRVGPGELLLALLESRDGSLKDLLGDREPALDALRRQIEKRTNRPLDRPTASEETFSGEVRDILQRARTEAQEAGQSRAGVPHLLLAMLHDREGFAAKVLLGLGLKPRALREEVRRHLGTVRKPSLASPETLDLIRRARAGDREAWESLWKHFYPKWYRTLHGQLGADLHQLYDTEDIIHSALGDALRGISSLRSEAAFFVWISLIIRHKIAQKRRALPRQEAIPLDLVPEPGKADSQATRGRGPVDDPEKVLLAITELRSRYPDPIDAVYLKYFERQDTQALMKLFGKSKRSVHRLVQTGLELLRTRLTST
jgi:DNA-directed RNA polymerase specialized sigma24 family protein